MKVIGDWLIRNNLAVDKFTCDLRRFLLTHEGLNSFDNCLLRGCETALALAWPHS